MKKLKKLKKIRIGYILAFAIIIAAVVLLIKLVLPGAENKYGDRCEGTKNNPFTEKEQKKVLKSITDRDSIVKGKINIDCKLINIEYVVKKEVSKDDAKNVAGEAYNLIPEKIRNMYDVQFMISKDKEEGTKTTDTEGKEITKYEFPVMGYSNKKNGGIIWSNN